MIHQTYGRKLIKKRQGVGDGMGKGCGGGGGEESGLHNVNYDFEYGISF